MPIADAAAVDSTMLMSYDGVQSAKLVEKTGRFTVAAIF